MPGAIVAPGVSSIAKDLEPKELEKLAKATRNYIPISAIFGYSEGQATIEDHPDFPNPRDPTRMSREIIDGVKESGKFDDDLLVFRHTDGNIIILDGKTRMTSAAEERAEHPDSKKFERVPIQWFKGTVEEAQIEQIRRNLPGLKDPLNEVEQAVAIKRLIDIGIAREKIAKNLGWEGRGGSRRVNNVLAILDSNPDLLKKFLDRRLTVAEASRIAKDTPFSQQAEKGEELAKAKEDGLSATEARKKADVAQQRLTALSFKETFEYAADIYYDCKRYLKLDFEAGGSHKRNVRWDTDFSEDPKLKTRLKEGEVSRDQFLDERNTLVRFEMCMKHLRQDGKGLREQMLWLESQMSDEQKQGLLEWMLPDPKDSRVRISA
jgi:hypothetical protein